jgi:FdrA protein
MLAGLKALQQDPETRLIILVSKPPATEVADRVVEQVVLSQKPTVVCLLGGSIPIPGVNEQRELHLTPGVIFAHTLEQAASLAVSYIKTGSWDILSHSKTVQTGRKLPHLQPSQRYLRALFSGGTLCYEAQVVWKDLLSEPVLSNAPLNEIYRLPDSLHSQGHCALDLGEEEFTVGRPHPMLDNDLRIRRLLQEASDPQVAVIMLDVVLGYGAHPDPASELAPAIRQARQCALDAGRELPVIASVTGTEGDPQGFSRQVKTLEAAGVEVCESNAAAARMTARVVR